MRYLYGDSSPFPLNQNFLETLAAATDCCASLLRVDENIGKAAKVADQANSAAMKELADIDQLVQRVEKALKQRDHLSNATAKVVEQVAATAKGQFDKARDGIQSWRDGTIRKAQRGCGPSDIMAPIHRFLVKHELPYTSWGLRWKTGRNEEPVQAQVYAIMQRGLTATLAVAIPSRHMWAQPIRVGQLEPGIVIQLMGKNWLGKEKMLDENLDKHFIVRVTRTSERHALILSRKAKEPSDMLRLSLREGEVKRTTVQRIDDDENAIGEALTLTGQDAQQVKRLWRQIEESVCDLVHYRSQLLAATLYNKRVTEIESPSTIAVSLIQSIAPLVRDLKRHSRTPGELQLKRDLGDGRREELFIDEKEVTGKISILKPKNQQLFDCFGLTTTRVPDEPAASQPAPSRPAASRPAPSRPAPDPSQPSYAGSAAEPRANPSQPAREFKNETTDAIVPPPIPPAPAIPSGIPPATADGTHQLQAYQMQPYVPAFPSEQPPPVAPASQPAQSHPHPAQSRPAPSRPQSRPAPAAGRRPTPAQRGGAPIPSRPPTRPPAVPPARGHKPLPSSIPPPSHPPRRRTQSGNQGHPAGQGSPSQSGSVFKLPAPTVPPQKRKGTKSNQDLLVG